MDTDLNLAEVEKEKGISGYGVEVDRDIPVIDLANFFARKAANHRTTLGPRRPRSASSR